MGSAVDRHKGVHKRVDFAGTMNYTVQRHDDNSIVQNNIQVGKQVPSASTLNPTVTKSDK